MDNWDSMHIKQIKDNTEKIANAFTRIADILERLADRKAEPRYDFGDFADRLWEIAYERGKREALEQTEPQTNCPESCPSKDICTKDDTDCAWK